MSQPNETELSQSIRKHALINAIKHDGKADIKAVMSRIMADVPAARSKSKTVRELVDKIVAEINNTPLIRQKEMAGELAPDYFVESKKTAKKELPPLPDAAEGKVVTRLAPEPNGYIHLGNAMSFNFNFLYARRYLGTLWLRFEDTNPKKEKKEYYNAIKDDIKWLEIKWDKEKSNSDDLETFYDFAGKLLEQGKAYICSCPLEGTRKNRASGLTCACRENPPSRNIELWDQMLSNRFKEGEVVWRIKGDMQSTNYVMRDPTLFRIVDSPHALKGSKYNVWPTYDFAVAIEDSICGVTHVLRSNEFALRGELQTYIRTLLDLRGPIILEYSRFNFEGTPTSKRLIKPLVDSGAVSGWDDIRLSTIRGVRRRGIIPKAIQEFTVHIGISRAQPVFSWDLLLSINRKILDPIAKRYFFVEDPVKIIVQDAPRLVVKLKHHPDIDLGYREVETGDTFYIPRKDLVDAGGLLRLKDLYNVKVVEKSAKSVTCRFAGRDLVEGITKVQWTTEEFVPIEVLVPGLLYEGDSLNKHSLTIVKGYGENSCGETKVDEHVQFERFGFCRIDQKKGNSITACFTHR
ncbi:MAG: glutamate--tRNA ligase [Promethearchaeati archaeon SRVP18_Atabeyarchaeia-1]